MNCFPIEVGEKMAVIKIGVLALQGDFERHIEVFKRLGINAIEVRNSSHLEDCDALVIPGGESTAMTRQLEFSGLTEKITSFAEKKPIWGTCAGIILMSKSGGSEKVQAFGLLDLDVDRNAYGRQYDSFSAPIELAFETNDPRPFKAVFIRAPKIRSYDKSAVKILAEYEGQPVLVSQGIHLGSTFHPELTDDFRIHHYFLTTIIKLKHNELSP
jgi:5'-phosphate synthase pdxT subunit